MGGQHAACLFADKFKKGKMMNKLLTVVATAVALSSASSHGALLECNIYKPTGISSLMETPDLAFQDDYSGGAKMYLKMTYRNVAGDVPPAQWEPIGQKMDVTLVGSGATMWTESQAVHQEGEYWVLPAQRLNPMNSGKGYGVRKVKAYIKIIHGPVRGPVKIEWAYDSGWNLGPTKGEIMAPGLTTNVQYGWMHPDSINLGDVPAEHEATYTFEKNPAPQNATLNITLKPYSLSSVSLWKLNEQTSNGNSNITVNGDYQPAVLTVVPSGVPGAIYANISATLTCN